MWLCGWLDLSSISRVVRAWTGDHVTTGVFLALPFLYSSHRVVPILDPQPCESIPVWKTVKTFDMFPWLIFLDTQRILTSCVFSSIILFFCSLCIKKLTFTKKCRFQKEKMQITEIKFLEIIWFHHFLIFLTWHFVLKSSSIPFWNLKKNEFAANLTR